MIQDENELADGKRDARASFQDRVQPWMLACFGAEISSDKVERGDRLLEEVLELLQSGGYDPARVAYLRDYVWSRPAGEPSQEVGGVQVTLAAYCLAFGLDMHEAGETELARIWTKVDKIRAKQAAKPVGSALPVAALPGTVQPVAVVKELDWRSEGWPVAWYADRYKIWQQSGYYIVSGWDAGTNPYDNLDAAKAAAQADFETRIRSSLIPAPMAGDGGAVVEAVDEIKALVVAAFNDGRLAKSNLNAAAHRLNDLRAALANPRLPGEGSK